MNVCSRAQIYSGPLHIFSYLILKRYALKWVPLTPIFNIPQNVSNVLTAARRDKVKFKLKSKSIRYQRILNTLTSILFDKSVIKILIIIIAMFLLSNV